MFRFIRSIVVALALAVCVSAVVAQEHVAPSTAQQGHSTAPAATPAGQTGEHAATPADPNRATDEQLAHESKEAAGGDEHAEFKESAAVKLLARLTGLSVKGAYYLALVLNFLIIAFLIYWFSKSSVPAMFRNRSASIKMGIEEARRASAEANARLQGIEQRLARLDVEVDAVRAAAETDFREEEQRIRQAAEDDARRIVELAEQEIAAATKTARRELTAYAADLAVDLAEKKIKVDDPTDQALVRRFVGQLGSDERKDGR